ncbi:uncharacterized protein [Palaemon carinicauda]|uniref:uncharacterized protein n=1 Tax=Palaemon carinicauda TaxID=392227 RepID=UPI0035B59D14
MDVLSEEIRNEEFWELLYVDDLVITSEKEVDFQRRVVEWQETFERDGLRVNMDKTEVIVTNKERRDRITMHESKGSILKQMEQFRYLGSSIRQEGGCEAKAKDRIKAAKGKWREVARVVCDKKRPIELKAKMDRTVIRPVSMYGLEMWALRGKEDAKLERTDMRMLRWITGIITA